MDVNTAYDVLTKFGILQYVLFEFCVLSLITWPSLARVYVIGRYLNIVKTDNDSVKNLIGIIWMFILSFVVIGWFSYRQEIVYLKFESREKLVEYILTALAHYSIAILYYAFVCWSAFDRVKSFITRKLKKA